MSISFHYYCVSRFSVKLGLVVRRDTFSSEKKMFVLLLLSFRLIFTLLNFHSTNFRRPVVFFIIFFNCLPSFSINLVVEAKINSLIQHCKILFVRRSIRARVVTGRVFSLPVPVSLETVRPDRPVYQHE
jgi:hypothetical protein